MAQLYGMVLDNITEGNISSELSLEVDYPQYTMEELNEKFDTEGNMIIWRRRFSARVTQRVGRVEGRAEGKTSGRAEERLSNLQQVLQGKFDVISAAQLATVIEHRDEPDMCTRIIKADSVDELLKSLC